MGNYQKITPLAPKDIQERNAYLIGGGIGSLSAAAFLIRDAHMPGNNIHVMEQLTILGGSMDGAEVRKKATVPEAAGRSKSILNVLWNCTVLFHL